MSLPNTISKIIPFIFEENTEKKQLQTWRLNKLNLLIDIQINEKESIIQSVYSILMTEKGVYDIYPTWYGTNLYKYIGFDILYTLANIQDVITKDLKMSDDRILNCTNFIIELKDKVNISVEFVVETIYGLIDYNFILLDGKIGD